LFLLTKAAVLDLQSKCISSSVPQKKGKQTQKVIISSYTIYLPNNSSIINVRVNLICTTLARGNIILEYWVILLFISDPTKFIEEISWRGFNHVQPWSSEFLLHPENHREDWTSQNIFFYNRIDVQCTAGPLVDMAGHAFLLRWI
jgi:hypothetical protein